MSTPERGQALPLLLVLLVAATGAAVLVAEIGVAMAERTRAQTAADAAALAGAVEGARAAERIATANGATLLGYRDLGDVVEVEVRHQRARAVAAAEATVAAADGHDLAPIVRAALARAEQVLGHPVPVLGGAGVVVEVHPDVVDELRAITTATGLCQQGPPEDPVDFAPCPPTPPR